LFFGFLVGLFLIGTTLRAADDANSGTWKMNATKSKYDPGPTPKEVTTTIESDETKYKVDSHTVNADGSESHITFDAKRDGKDYPLTGTPNADTISLNIGRSLGWDRSVSLTSPLCVWKVCSFRVRIS
jgi:hypothetical protein